MSIKSAGHFAFDAVRAALLVMRWSLGMMVLGGLLSAVAAAVLLDEATLWVRSGIWGQLATVVVVMALLALPWIWGWLGRALGIRKAILLLVGPRAEAALQMLLGAIDRQFPSDAAGSGSEQIMAVLRRPARVSGPARWLAWLLRWHLDLDQTQAHLEAAQARAQSEGAPPQAALAQALIADAGERWLEPDASMLWALAISEILVISTLAWLW